MPLAAGARLGPYEIGAPIGKGGMGEVCRARDTKLGRDVAIEEAEIRRDPVGDSIFELYTDDGRRISNLVMVLQQLAQVLCDQGDYEEAVSSFTEASDIVQPSFGIYHPYLARLRVAFGTCLTKLGRYQAAEEQIVAAVGVLRTALGDGDRQTNRAIQSLAALYEAWGKPEKAAEYRALLEETEKALPRPQ